MKIIWKLLSSQDLCKLIYYSSDNPLGEVDISDTRSLLFNEIYPIPKIPDSESKASSLLTLVFDDMRLTNVAIKNSIISINVMCHIDLWRLSGQSALRPFLIMNQIDEMLNNERVVGLGKMVFDKSRFIFIDKFYSGYRMDYKIVDFN